VMPVRRFDAGDLLLVEQHVPQRKISAVHRERLARQDLGECRYLLALSNETPVGWALLIVGRDQMSEWQVRYECTELQDLYVAPSARRQGFGAELLTSAERFSRELGFLAIGLSTAEATDSDYAPARRLYETRGYIEVGAEEFPICPPLAMVIRPRPTH